MKRTVYVVVYFMEGSSETFIYGVFGNEAGAHHASKMINSSTDYASVVMDMDFMSMVDTEKHPFTEEKGGETQKN